MKDLEQQPVGEGPWLDHLGIYGYQLTPDSIIEVTIKGDVYVMQPITASNINIRLGEDFAISKPGKNGAIIIEKHIKSFDEPIIEVLEPNNPRINQLVVVASDNQGVIGTFGFPQGGIRQGEYLQFNGRFGLEGNFPVDRVRAINILPDINTKKTIDLVRLYFKEKYALLLSDTMSGDLGKLAEYPFYELAFRTYKKPLERSALRDKVSAIIMKLINDASENGKLEMTEVEFKEMMDVLTTFVTYQSKDLGGGAQIHKKKFTVKSADGDNVLYELEARITFSDNQVIYLVINKLPTERQPPNIHNKKAKMLRNMAVVMGFLALSGSSGISDTPVKDNQKPNKNGSLTFPSKKY